MPLDLNESKEEAAQFTQMQQELPIETPAEEPAKVEAEPAKVEEPVKEEPKEPVKEAVKEDPEKAKLERKIPFAALLEERQKRKAAEQTLAELRKAAENPQPKEAALDPQTDPITVIERQQKWIEQREQQDREHQQMTAFQQHVISQEQAYIAENPEYPKAVEFLKNARVREMKEGLGMSDAMIQQALAAEAAQTARYALENDLNPAEIFYNLARVRGFSAEPAQVAAEPVQVQPDPAAVNKLASLAKGQKAAKTVSNGGGGAALPTPSLEAIAALDGADFDAAWKSGAVKRLMQ